MRVIVLGDVMLDWDNIAEVSRISPEAPILVADVVAEYFRLGGAANVAHNLRKLGCDVTVCGVVGEDYFGEVLTEYIRQEQITPCLFSTSGRVTTVKQRFLSDHNVHLFRGDREDRTLISDDIQASIVEYIKSQVEYGIDGIVVADYAKGFVGQYLASVLNDINVPVFADLKPKNMHLFHNLEVMTPNEKEAFEYFRTQNAVEENFDIKQVGGFLQAQSKNVIITLGAKGIMLFNSDYTDGILLHSSVNTNGYNIVDTCGCGDVVTAVFTYVLLSGYSAIDAAKVANSAAGMTVKDVGVSTISSEQLKEILLSKSI